MSPESLAIGLAGGIGLWGVMSVLWTLSESATLSERIAPSLWDISPVAREHYQTVVEDPISVAGYVLSPAATALVTTLDNFFGGKETQQAVFEASGRKEDFISFRRQRVLRAAAGFGGGLVVGLVGAGIAGAPVVAVSLGLATLGGMVSVGWGDYRLRKQAAARAEKIGEEFPTVIELLGLALAAGDSLPRALFRVSSRAKGELGQEWASVMSQVELGAPLSETLRNSAQRVGNDRVVAFVEHLAQALERGAPLAEVVGAHSVDARQEYSRTLVERSGKAEVRMLVPMVLLILPVTVIFAVYPGIQALSFEF